MIFVALLVFTILAMCGVMVSDWAGYQSIRKNKANEPVESAHDLPMSKSPAAPIDMLEYSFQNTECLHL